MVVYILFNILFIKISKRYKSLKKLKWKKYPQKIQKHASKSNTDRDTLMWSDFLNQSSEDYKNSNSDHLNQPDTIFIILNYI